MFMLLVIAVFLTLTTSHSNICELPSYKVLHQEDQYSHKVLSNFTKKGFHLTKNCQLTCLNAKNLIENYKALQSAILGYDRIDFKHLDTHILDNFDKKEALHNLKHCHDIIVYAIEKLLFEEECYCTIAQFVSLHKFEIMIPGFVCSSVWIVGYYLLKVGAFQSCFCVSGNRMKFQV